MKFKKKQFQKEYKSKVKNVEELYEPDDEFGGDKPNIPSASQITTDTQKAFDSKTDYEEDIPQTGDDYRAVAKNNANKHHPYGPNMGDYPYGYGSTRIKESDLDEAAKEKMEKIIRELLSKKDLDRDFVNKGSASDINNNNIPDIDEIEHSDSITTVNGLIEAIYNGVNTNKLDSEGVGVVLLHLVNELNKKRVNLHSIPEIIKKEIKSNL